MTSQNLKYKKYTSCTIRDHLKYYTIFALEFALALSRRDGSHRDENVEVCYGSDEKRQD